MATVVELDQERFANICLWNYLELSSFHWSVVYCLFNYLEDMGPTFRIFGSRSCVRLVGWTPG